LSIHGRNVADPDRVWLDVVKQCLARCPRLKELPLERSDHLLELLAASQPLERLAVDFDGSATATEPKRVLVERITALASGQTLRRLMLRKLHAACDPASGDWTAVPSFLIPRGLVSQQSPPAGFATLARLTLGSVRISSEALESIGQLSMLRKLALSGVAIINYGPPQVPISLSCPHSVCLLPSTPLTPTDRRLRTSKDCRTSSTGSSSHSST
jgi:hypothetical protein